MIKLYSLLFIGSIWSNCDAQEVTQANDPVPPHMDPNYQPYAPDLQIIKKKGDRDTLFLKHRFNPKEGYISFNFDYDVLNIDTSWWSSGNGNYSISYNGFIYDTDSFISNGIPQYLSELEPRFTIRANKEYTEYIQEYTNLPRSENFSVYRNDPVNGLKFFDYFNDDFEFALRFQSEETERYSIDENDSLVKYKAKPSRDVIFDDLTIRTDTLGNVISFYHDDHSLELLSPEKENGKIYFTYHSNGFMHERYRIDEEENKKGTYIRYNDQEIIVESGSYVVRDSIELKNGTWNYYNNLGVPIRVDIYKIGELVSSQNIKLKKVRKKE